MRDNIPCREACAVKLAPDHTSKLDAVLVDPCFIQCLLARKEERRGERERKETEKGGGRERSKERSKDRKEERESPPLPPVLMSSTPPCVVSKRIRVKRQDARMLNTCFQAALVHWVNPVSSAGHVASRQNVTQASNCASAIRVA